MSNLRNKLAIGSLMAASAISSGCDPNECRVVSENEASPQLNSTSEVLVFCSENQAQALSCLEVESGEDTDKCTQRTFQCGTTTLESGLNAFFSGNGEYCVEGPATLDFDF